jgi:hypothetical protein
MPGQRLVQVYAGDFDEAVGHCGPFSNTFDLPVRSKMLRAESVRNEDRRESLQCKAAK